MTLTELREQVEQGEDRLFFDKEPMRFYGDSMSNYGVRDNGSTWELYRKQKVRFGIQESAYFDKQKFNRVFIS